MKLIRIITSAITGSSKSSTNMIKQTFQAQKLQFQIEIPSGDLIFSYWLFAKCPIDASYQSCFLTCFNRKYQDYKPSTSSVCIADR